MKLQNMHTIDFSKANRQIKDISLKFLQSKMLRKNKENCNPQQHHETRAQILLHALQKPLQRILCDLIYIRRSVVCERNIFDEVFSVGVSENSDIGEGFKISFANLNVKSRIETYKSNAPIIMFMVMQNLRRKNLMVSFQEIKFFILHRNLTQVNGKLQNAQREQLRKVVSNKLRQEVLLMQVYLKYWSQQTQLIIFFEHFGEKINRVYRSQMRKHLEVLNSATKKREAVIKFAATLKNRLVQYMLAMQSIRKHLCLQHRLSTIFVARLKLQFDQFRNGGKLVSSEIFVVLHKQQNKQMMISIRHIQLHVLRKSRREKSITFGLEDLTKAVNKVNCNWAFQRLQNKQLKLKFLFQARFLGIVLGKILQRKLNQAFRKLNQ